MNKPSSSLQSSQDFILLFESKRFLLTCFIGIVSMMVAFSTVPHFSMGYLLGSSFVVMLMTFVYYALCRREVAQNTWFAQQIAKPPSHVRLIAHDRNVGLADLKVLFWEYTPQTRDQLFQREAKLLCHIFDDNYAIIRVSLDFEMDSVTVTGVEDVGAEKAKRILVPQPLANEASFSNEDA